MANISVNLEKAFFAKVLDDPKQFHKVEHHFFDNAPIRLVFNILKENYIKSPIKEIPSRQQIWTMVSMEDPEKIISKEILKSILEVDVTEYQDDWLDKKFKAWKTAKYTRMQLAESIDLIRKMDDIDFDTSIDIARRIKDNFLELDSMNNDDEDLGSDFDDPESHLQHISMNKMSSGWSNIDRLLGGGWDRATLNVIMGETSVGKCCKSSSYITIRNNKTGDVEILTIEDFYKNIQH